MTTTKSAQEATQEVANEKAEQKKTDLVETINTAIEEDQEVIIEQFDTERQDSTGNVVIKTRVTIKKNKKTAQESKKEKSDSVSTQQTTNSVITQSTKEETNTDKQVEVGAESPLTKVAIIIIALIIGAIALALIYLKLKK